MNINIIENKARELISFGKIDEAKEFLIQEGYEKQNIKQIQELFHVLISESNELTQERENSLGYLFDNDEKKRIESSNYIFKQSLKEYSNTRKSWLGDPRTVDILLQALDDENLKVRINIVGSFWMISNRYLKDIRIFEKLIYLLKDHNSEIRNYATLGLSNYSFDNKWDALISQLEKEKVNKVIESILGNFYIKSSLGMWGEISNKRLTNILERLEGMCSVQTNKEKQAAIRKTINWMKQNLIES